MKSLLASRGEDADAVDLQLVVDDPDAGIGSVAVVVDGDRVVSTATLLDETVELAGVTVPAGQVELVATDPAYESRGLVRALMAWAHRRSAGRGQLAQVMIGIPYFYRQFGYNYAIPMHRWRRVATMPGPVDGITVRAATAADIPAMARLQRAAQRTADLRMPHSPACWRWLVDRDGSDQLVAERDGQIVGTCRALPPAEGAVLGELAAGEPAAALALVAHRLAGADDPTVQERPGTIAGDAVEPLLAPPGDGQQREWYYARVADFGALLRHLAPVLVDRLRAAGMADQAHDVLISAYRSHVRFKLDANGISDLVTGGPEQAPFSKGGSGVPPDALADLVFGPHGAAGLAERLPDCYLGRQRELMTALFPPVSADLLTFYLSC